MLFRSPPDRSSYSLLSVLPVAPLSWPSPLPPLRRRASTLSSCVRPPACEQPSPTRPGAPPPCLGRSCSLTAAQSRDVARRSRGPRGMGSTSDPLAAAGLPADRRTDDQTIPPEPRSSSETAPPSLTQMRSHACWQAGTHGRSSSAQLSLDLQHEPCRRSGVTRFPGDRAPLRVAPPRIEQRVDPVSFIAAKSNSCSPSPAEKSCANRAFGICRKKSRVA